MRKTRFNPTRYLTFDVETTGLRVWHGDAPFALSLCDDRGRTEYHEWQVDPFTRRVSIPDRDIRSLCELFARRDIIKIGHNVKFDVRMLHSIGVDVAPPIRDTFILARVFNPAEIQFNLKSLSMRYCGVKREDVDRLQAETARLRRLARNLDWKLGPQVATDYWLPRAYSLFNPQYSDEGLCEAYCVQDSVRTAMLWEFYGWHLAADADFRHIMRIENRLWYAVYRMESRGVRVSLAQCARHRRALEKLSREELNQLRKLARKPDFNPRSPLQIRDVLYSDPPNGLGLPVHHQTKTGLASTSQDALREHMDSPFVRELLTYRGTDSTAANMRQYARLAVETDEGDAVIHADIDQAGARTGRFSCRQPNLQNVATASGTKTVAATWTARGPFGPRRGHVWVCCDFSQQEIRIFADVAQDRRMLLIFNAGRDIHTENARAFWGGRNNPSAIESASIALELGNRLCRDSTILDTWERLGWSAEKAGHYGARSESSRIVASEWLESFSWNNIAAEASIGRKTSRNRGKIVLYTSIYGGGAGALQDSLYCTRLEAQRMRRQFREQYPGIARWTDEIAQEARSNGFVRTLYGRKVRVAEDKAYSACNSVVQGTAADMLKLGILAVEREITQSEIEAYPVLPVHDELVIEFRKSHATNNAIQRVRGALESVGRGVFSIPIPVDVSIVRRSWDSKEAFEAVNGR